MQMIRRSILQRRKHKNRDYVALRQKALVIDSQNSDFKANRDNAIRCDEGQNSGLFWKLKISAS